MGADLESGPDGPLRFDHVQHQVGNGIRVVFFVIFQLNHLLQPVQPGATLRETLREQESCT